MQLFSQRDPRWATHPLGWGPPPPGYIGPFGCYLTCLSMVAWDAFKDTRYTPAALDDIFTARKIFLRDAGGDFDLMPDRPLDIVWPGRFRTTIVQGFGAGLIAPAVASPDTYVILWISTPKVPTHFVIAASKDAKLIADPWTGKIGSLAGYGGPAAVHRMIFIRKAVPGVVTIAKPPVVVTPPTSTKPPVVAPAVAVIEPVSPIDWDDVERHSLPAGPLPQPTPPPVEVVDASLQGILIALINLLPPDTRSAVANLFSSLAA